MLIFTKMKKEIFKEVEVPEGIEVEVNGTTLKVIYRKEKNQRNFKINNISLTKKDNLIVVGTKIATKKKRN